MSNARDNFMNESTSLLNAFECTDEVLKEVQKHLIDVAIFLSENNIKGLDASYVPSHLLNEYDAFAYEMENSEHIKDLFDRMDDGALINLRKLCESLASDLTEQRIEQIGQSSESERRADFHAKINEQLAKYNVSGAVIAQIKEQLDELAHFMIDNRLEYISVEDWPGDLQQDFERFATRFDSILEEHSELEQLNDDTLHGLLHFAEMYATTEISLRGDEFVDLEQNFSADKLQEDIKGFLEKELPETKIENLSPHFQDIASFMHKYNIPEVKLELAPENYRQDFENLLARTQHLQQETTALTDEKVNAIYQHISDLQENRERR